MRLAIDGMLSGTGVRDLEHGGYIDPLALGLSHELSEMIAEWLVRYADQHYHQFNDRVAVEKLDSEGMKITNLIRAVLLTSEVSYFSHAHMSYCK